MTKSFLRQVLETGAVQSIPFDATHYKEAGLLPSVLGGMPTLEALLLVNSWNIQQATQRYVYALA